MSFEKHAFFGIVELHYIAIAGGSLLFQTDTPGNAIATRETLTIPASAVRRTVKFRLKGTTKGKLFKVKVTSAGIVHLYGGRVFARNVGGGAGWGWIALAITPTSDEWTAYPLPIEKTEDAFRTIALPIAKTEDTFEIFKLPIAPTANEFTLLKIPMVPTPDLQDWHDIPVAP